MRAAWRSRECPICERRFRRFEPAQGRAHARCPRCGSLERHRHLWLFLQRHTPVGRQPLTLVHVAPDAATEARLRALPDVDYIAGDLEGERGGRVLDLTDLALEDHSVDAMIVYHVLEHVPDDRRALSEMRRVLRPGGWALVQVPTRHGATDEDPAVQTPQERLTRFGQVDHVRMYGEADFPARVQAAGLDCRAVVFRDEIAPADRERFGLAYPEAADPDDPRLWRVWVLSPR